MSSNTIRLIACRIYSLLFAAFGMLLMGGGLMLLYWSAYGAPAEVRLQLSETPLPMDLATFFALVGVVCVFIGGAHAALSILACLGRVWPMVAGTTCWALLIVPSLIRPEASPGSHKSQIIMLGTLAVLTVVALTPRIVSSVRVTPHTARDQPA